MSRNIYPATAVCLIILMPSKSPDRDTRPNIPLKFSGKPVFTYSYREAVADDWLIDHEPPIRYETYSTQNAFILTKASGLASSTPKPVK